jgi:hypothetical protein
VHAVLDIAASFSVQVFATMVEQGAPAPPKGVLRRDYAYLFERYFFFWFVSRICGRISPLRSAQVGFFEAWQDK